jgi:hypothetical protein
MRSLRERRIANEVGYLDSLVELNPGGLRLERRYVEGGADLFQLLLTSPAWSLDGAILHQHRLKLVFPEYFPAVPIEVYLETPVRHPNVHPENGFVCLWDRHAAGDTVVEALLQTQRVISGQLWNRETDHLMQPEASGPIALPFDPLRVPDSYYLEKSRSSLPEGHVRRRLSPLK